MVGLNVDLPGINMLAKINIFISTQLVQYEIA